MSFRKASTNFGSSLGCLDSTAIVTTGSDTYAIDSNCAKPFVELRVSPARACSRPNNAGILPAVNLPTNSR